jgi:3-oxoacyl-[acyl-carrier protein] reductase
VTAGAGLSTDDVRPQAREFIRAFNPMQRVGTLGDVADAAEYLASDLAGFVSGQHLLLSGGGPA